MSRRRHRVFWDKPSELRHDLRSFPVVRRLCMDFHIEDFISSVNVFIRFGKVFIRFGNVSPYNF